MITISETLPPKEMVADRLKPAPTTTTSLPFESAWKLARTSEAPDFVQGLFTRGGASVIYGPSNLGKTFLLLDIAACVATGRPFRDELEVEQGAVLYFSLEGRIGMQNRLDAMKHKGLIDEDAPFFISFAGLNLSLPPQKDDPLTYGEMIAATIREIEAQQPHRLLFVVIDTWSRALGSGDENSSRDTMIAVAELDHIRRETSAHVCVVHHTGKDESRGARGSGALRGAVDTEIELARPDGASITTMRCTKQRDLPIPPPMPFSLEVIHLGTDRRGDPITSCVVQHEDEMMATVKSKGGRKPSTSIPELVAMLPQPTTKAWKDAAAAELGIGKSSFFDLLKLVKSSSAAVCVKGTGWKVPEVRFPK